MALINQDVEMYSGDTKQLLVAVTTPTGTPVDLTGSIIKYMAVRGTAPVIQKSTTSGNIIITDAVKGKYTVKLDPADTRDLLGKYPHESEVTDALGNVSTVLKGTLKVLQSYIPS